MSRVHEINGKQYVEVNRKAVVGDLVNITRFDGRYTSVYRKVKKLDSDFENDFYLDVPIENEDYFDSEEDNCVILEPIVTATADSPESMIELLSNLARRVTSLEQQLADTQGNVETWAQQTESNTKDIAFLDERLLVTEGNSQPSSAETVIAEIARLVEKAGARR